jgi:hypothetical protein
LFASVVVFTHVPLHATCPVGQTVVQMPATQPVPAEQVIPHPPQLPLSVAVFTQVPLHSFSPDEHVAIQEPATHVEFDKQAA